MSLSSLLNRIDHITPRGSPNVNYGLCVMMCQCRFINRNYCTVLWSDVDNGGGYACTGQGVYGKSLHLPLNFIVDLNLLYKNKVFLKMIEILISCFVNAYIC